MSLKISIFNSKGKESKTMTLPKEVFDGKINPDLVAQAVHVYRSNQRKAYPKTKNRGEVSGSRKKIWQQKGTGRARHGDRYAPIFVGGGIAHGPNGNQNYSKKIPKKMKKKALIACLTAKQKEKKIIVVQGISRLRKTQSAKKMLVSWFGKKFNPNDKFLLILGKNLASPQRAFRNIANLNLVLADNLNSYQVLASDYLIFTKPAVEKLKERLTK